MDARTLRCRQFDALLSKGDYVVAYTEAQDAVPGVRFAAQRRKKWSGTRWIRTICLDCGEEIYIVWRNGERPKIAAEVPHEC